MLRLMAFGRQLHLVPEISKEYCYIDEESSRFNIPPLEELGQKRIIISTAYV
jgi:hypothetical protein